MDLLVLGVDKRGELAGSRCVRVRGPRSEGSAEGPRPANEPVHLSARRGPHHQTCNHFNTLQSLFVGGRFLLSAHTVYNYY